MDDPLDSPNISSDRRAGGRLVVHIIRGRDQILPLAPALMDFSESCDQAGAMHDLPYFLAKPGALARVPHLLLVGPRDLNPTAPDLKQLAGCVLTFEQHLFGRGIGAYATNDRSGRSTLIAPARRRMQVAALCCRALLNHGAHLILLSFRSGEAEPMQPGESVHLPIGRRSTATARWALRERVIPGYLPLGATYDATLANIGQKTRSNLRYYRRRAEKLLGCQFLPQIPIKREELLAFNRQSMFPVPDGVAARRHDSLAELAQPILMGIKEDGGRWLSILGGRRYLDRSELLWQFNRAGMSAYSLSTVMRSYFIEHEVNRQMGRIYIEGGTPHPIRFSFVPEVLDDLIVMRQTLKATAIQRAARHYLSKDNELSNMLNETNLTWHPC